MLWYGGWERGGGEVGNEGGKGGEAAWTIRFESNALYHIVHVSSDILYRYQTIHCVRSLALL